MGEVLYGDPGAAVGHADVDQAALCVSLRVVAGRFAGVDGHGSRAVLEGVLNQIDDDALQTAPVGPDDQPGSCCQGRGRVVLHRLFWIADGKLHAIGPPTYLNELGQERAQLHGLQHRVGSLGVQAAYLE